jgi:hypothetical protein
LSNQNPAELVVSTGRLEDLNTGTAATKLETNPSEAQSPQSLGYFLTKNSYLGALRASAVNDFWDQDS